MAAEEDSTGDALPHYLDCAPQALLVSLGSATGWPVRLGLTKGQIAAENDQPSFAKGDRQSHKQGRLAVSTSAVGEDESIARRMCRQVKIAPYRKGAKGRIFKRLELGLCHLSTAQGLLARCYCYAGNSQG